MERDGKIDELLYAAGRTRYESQHYGNSGEHCARQLDGRSHYYDAGTRRYFGCRVLDVGTDADGACLFTVESVTPPSGGRLYRAVAFNCEGAVIHRTANETNGFAGYKTAAAARRELSAFRADLDVEHVTREALAARIKHESGRIDALRAALEAA